MSGSSENISIKCRHHTGNKLSSIVDSWEFEREVCLDDALNLISGNFGHHRMLLFVDCSVSLLLAQQMKETKAEKFLEKIYSLY